MHSARWLIAVAEEQVIRGPMRLLGCVALLAGVLIGLGRVLASEDE
jgi:hypothetical protein